MLWQFFLKGILFSHVLCLCTCYLYLRCLRSASLLGQLLLIFKSQHLSRHAVSSVKTLTRGLFFLCSHCLALTALCYNTMLCACLPSRLLLGAFSTLPQWSPSFLQILLCLLRLIWTELPRKYLSNQLAVYYNSLQEGECARKTVEPWPWV